MSSIFSFSLSRKSSEVVSIMDALVKSVFLQTTRMLVASFCQLDELKIEIPFNFSTLCSLRGLLRCNFQSMLCVAGYEISPP